MFSYTPARDMTIWLLAKHNNNLEMPACCTWEDVVWKDSAKRKERKAKWTRRITRTKNQQRKHRLSWQSPEFPFERRNGKRELSVEEALDDKLELEFWYYIVPEMTMVCLSRYVNPALPLPKSFRYIPASCFGAAFLSTQATFLPENMAQ